ncbi:MAG: hypothetical protein ABH859_00485 [Pseudomonadota bacterium]
MQINNTSKTFKVETVDLIENTPQAQTTTEPMSLDELNSLGQSESTSLPVDAANSDPLASYGINYNGTTPEQEQAVLERLANFPPPVTDILAQKENGINGIHILRKLYENSENDLRALLANYQVLIDSRALGADQVSLLQQKVALIQNDRLPFIAQQINECDRLAAHNEYIGEMELKSLTDLNGDGYLGLESDPRRLGISETTDGKKVFLNPTTGEVVPPPFYLESDSIFTRNDTLKVLGADETVFNEEDYPQLEADVHFGLDLSKLGQGSGKFGTDIEIMVPQYWWVKNGESISAEIRTDTLDRRYYQADELLTIDENGIRQDVSLIDDMSKYRQIRIAGVRIVSHADPIDSLDGIGGAIHKIEFLDKDDNVLFSATIEGANTSEANSVSAELASGENRVYASSVGFSLNGDQTTYPMEVDVSQFTSHARQILDDFYGTLGIPADKQEEYRNNPRYMAAEDNRRFFENPDYVSKFWQVTDFGSPEDGAAGQWFELAHNDNFQGNMVCRSTDPTTDVDTRSSLQSGIFMQGFRGDIRGTRYNDLILVRGANEYSEEFVPEDALDGIEPITYLDDTPYTTSYDGLGGAVVVQIGAGNLNATGVNFAYFEGNKTDTARFKVRSENKNSNSNSSNDGLDADILDRIIGDVPDCVREPNSGDIQDSRRQPQNHIYASAGSIYLVDQEIERDSDRSDNEAYSWGLDGDDYYELDGIIYTTDYGNKDIQGQANLTDANVCGAEAVEECINDWRAEFETYNQEINSIEDLEATQTEWLAAGENYRQLAEETASFFEAMFGEKEEIFAEWEQYKANYNL